MANARGVAFAILVLGTAARGQNSPDRAYALFGFGGVGEQTDTLRPRMGPALQLGIGRRWRPQVSGEVALDGAWFHAPNTPRVGYQCPATGCGPLPGYQSDVMTSSLTANVVLSDGQSRGFCRAGLGVRALLADPQYAGKKSALAQLDFGATVHGDAGTWLIGPRFQATIDRATPRWAISLLVTGHFERR